MKIIFKYALLSGGMYNNNFKILFKWLFTLAMLKFLYTILLPNFYPANLKYSIYKYVFTNRVEISVDPDQMDLDLQCFQDRIHLVLAGQGLNFLNS